MLGSEKLIGFVGTTDQARAREFYQHTLGLKLLSEDSFALAFDISGTMLRVTTVPELRPAKFTVVGWQVSDISAAVSRLQASGIKFERYEGIRQDEKGIWSAPGGAKIAWFKDPDENILSLTELS
jgi:catechol 2,3-dioxygenase-like lactoylglutathione lyase family enzyme